MKSVVGTKLGAPSKGVIVSDGYAEGKTAMYGRLRMRPAFIAWCDVMKRFVEGQSRKQGALLPESLDDFVAEANPVRVIDVFVDEFDLRKLGFTGVDPAATGTPAYHPAVLLKLYIYGDLG